MRLEFADIEWTNGVRGVAVTAVTPDGERLDAGHWAYVQPPTDKHMIYGGADTERVNAMIEALPKPKQAGLRATTTKAVKRHAQAGKTPDRIDSANPPELETADEPDPEPEIEPDTETATAATRNGPTPMALGIKPLCAGCGKRMSVNETDWGWTPDDDPGFCGRTVPGSYGRGKCSRPAGHDGDCGPMRDDESVSGGNFWHAACLRRSRAA